MKVENESACLFSVCCYKQHLTAAVLCSDTKWPASNLMLQSTRRHTWGCFCRIIRIILFLYLGGLGFRYRSGGWPSLQLFFVAFLSFFMQKPSQCLKLCHDGFLARPMTHYSTLRTHTSWPADRVLNEIFPSAIKNRGVWSIAPRVLNCSTIWRLVFSVTNPSYFYLGERAFSRSGTYKENSLSPILKYLACNEVNALKWLPLLLVRN